jgi:hypothetical protein
VATGEGNLAPYHRKISVHEEKWTLSHHCFSLEIIKFLLELKWWNQLLSRIREMIASLLCEQESG